MSTTEAPNYELMSALATLLEAGKYSDLTILCGPKKYAVHRAIICSRSGFFDGACSSPFREAETGVIDLSEDDPEAVEHMVNYFYHLDYLIKPRSRRTSNGSSRNNSRPASPSNLRRRKFSLALVEDPLLAQAAASAIVPRHANPLTPPVDAANRPFDFGTKIPPPDTPIDDELETNAFEFPVPEQELNQAQPYLIVHAKVYAIAEKYGIKGLKSLARKKFASQIAHHWSSTEFSDAMQEVYEATVDEDRGLRDIVVQTFRAHPELARRKDVEAVVKDTPTLAWELFRVGWGMPV